MAKKVVTVPDNERVPLKLPRIDGGNESEYVSVNDYSCIIPRGVQVLVPKFVYDEVMRSETAKDNLFLLKDAKRNNAQ